MISLAQHEGQMHGEMARFTLSQFKSNTTGRALAENQPDSALTGKQLAGRTDILKSFLLSCQLHSEETYQFSLLTLGKKENVPNTPNSHISVA